MGCRAGAAGWRRLGCALPLAGRQGVQLRVGPPLPSCLAGRGAVSTEQGRWPSLVGAVQVVPGRAGLAAAAEAFVNAAPPRPAACIRPQAELGLVRVARVAVPRGNAVGERTFATKSSQTFRKRFKLKPNGRLKHKLAGNNHKTSTKNRKRKNRIKKGGFTTETAARSIRRWVGKSTKA